MRSGGFRGDCPGQMRRRPLHAEALRGTLVVPGGLDATAAAAWQAEQLAPWLQPDEKACILLPGQKWFPHVCSLKPGDLGLSEARSIRYKVPAHVVRLCRDCVGSRWTCSV
jgi:hypothetical protein